LPLRFAIPDRPLEIAHLLLDVNGTLTDRGLLIDGVVHPLQEREGVASLAPQDAPSPANPKAHRT
jgi:hypothetical protein